MPNAGFNPTNLNVFFTQLETLFQRAIRNAAPWSQKFATRYSANTQYVLQGWIGMVDNPRIWNGSRVVQDFAPQTYQVPMLPWELTAQIDQFLFMFDQAGIYGPAAERLGQKSAKLMDYAIRDLLQGNGQLGQAPYSTGPDGVSFWNSAHPVDVYDPAKGTYCNDYGTAGVSISGTTVGGYFSTNSYATVWNDMAQRKNESNEAIGVVPDTWLGPPQLRFQAAVVLQSMFFSPPSMLTLGAGNAPTPGAPSPVNAPFVGNMENPLKGTAALEWTADLSGQSTAWYLADNSSAQPRPLGWAVFQDPTMVVRNAPQDPVVFDQHRYLWGMWAIATPHWGFPWSMSRSGV
jgi:phage major head subunit gpT-like protein